MCDFIFICSTLFTRECRVRFALKHTPYWDIPSLRSLAVRDNKPQGREEPGRETTENGRHFLLVQWKWPVRQCVSFSLDKKANTSIKISQGTPSMEQQ